MFVQIPWSTFGRNFAGRVAQQVLGEYRQALCVRGGETLVERKARV